ncbi:MAG: acylphosphatase [archaeon]|nr:acylphosphatase [archaeon]
MSSNKTDDNLTANTIIVDGIVQRVGFRRFVEKLARQNRIMGYAANRKDGTVTIFAQGESKENLEQFISQLKNAPSPILVERLDTKEARPRTSLKRFEIRVGSLADEMMEGFGAMETQFSDYRKDFRDYREEFRDYRREFRGFAQQTENNFGAIDMKYGEISQKLTQILDELRTENREAISSLNKSVDALIQAVDKLSKN